jgi:predicted SAM-dependent methyltransferase
MTVLLLDGARVARGSRKVVRPVLRSARRSAARRRLDRSIPPGARIHLGCGPNRLEGWVNVDIDRRSAADVRHDLRIGLPARAGTVSRVYSEHVFEHLELEDGVRLLADIRRVLRPGGIVRIAMPDLRALVDAYLGDWEDQTWLQNPAFDRIDTPAHMLNVSMHEWGHRYLYDWDELRLRLQQAGFVGVERCEWGRSESADLAGLETRSDSKLIAEATAP